MVETTAADVVLTNARFWTQDAGAPWAEAVALRDGVIVAVGTSDDVQSVVGPETAVHDLGGSLVVPGLSDVHIHLGLGGGQTIELPILPSDDLEEVLRKVADWGSELPADDWIVGGIIGSTVMDQIVTSSEHLARLDSAAAGRPVLLRDDTMHNRWVNSAALKVLQVDETSSNPEGGEFVRDADGKLTGVLYELASTLVEAAFVRSLTDPAARKRTSLLAAQQLLFELGVTSVQDAGTMLDAWDAVVDLDKRGEWKLKLVASTPVRPFIEDGVVGDELIEAVSGYESNRVKHGFVKVIMDGIPMTRTAAMLQPYLCSHDHDDPEFKGELYWTDEDLEAQVRSLYEKGLGAKFHATGDASIRQVLDAAEKITAELGAGPILQVAHVAYPDPADIPRFGELGVIADVSPHLWYPSVMIDSMRVQVPADIIEASSPIRTLRATGALVAAGSDWPCASPTPNPWPGLEAMVTRQNPDGVSTLELAPGEKVSVEEAFATFSSAPAEAMGIGATTGRIKVGYAADLAVLDRDIFTVDAHEIGNTVVLRTYASGEVVHDRL